MPLPTSKQPLPGFRLIADNAGSYIDDVNNIRLGPEFVLSRNTADPSAVVSVAQYIEDQIAAAIAAAVPNSGSEIGRLALPVLIDKLEGASAVAGFTSTSFTANAYRKLILEFQGSISGGSYAGFRVNNDTATNYADGGSYLPTNGGGVAGAFSDGASAANGFARVAHANTAGGSPASGQFTVDFFPLKKGTSGRRVGHFRSYMYANTNNPASDMIFSGSFAWNNSGTDVTQIRVINSGSETFTGDFYLWGVPA